MTTWADFNPSAGGPRLLPEGIRNFTIVSAIPEVNEYNGKRQIVFRFTSAEGSGQHEVDIEAAQPQHQETVSKILLSWMKLTGFTPSNPNMDVSDPTVAARALLPEYASFLPALAGAVVELSVTHSEYPRRNQDGTPKLDDEGRQVMGKRQRVYLNKLVRPAAHAPATAGAQGAVPADFAAPAAPAYDDIPF